MNPNVRGGVIMLVAVGSFSLMDAGLKALSPSYPPLQIAAIRSFAALPIIAVWIALTGGFRGILRARFALHALRAAIGIVMLGTFIYAVRHLPLSEAYSIFFVAPLLITASAALILHERIEWQRWAAIVVGLAGVLIVLKPSGAGLVTLPGLAIVVCAIGYALSAIMVRILGRTDSTQTMVFWLLTFVGCGAAVLALPNWRAIESRHWPVIASVAVTGCIGQWALTEAFRIGEASFIAPFEYTALGWGLALDWFLWRTVPGVRAFAGAGVIIASGLYLIHRERLARRRVT
jgi:drug/metabolite transporter (DMT)-like permease